MSSALIFTEPTDPSVGRLARLADWLGQTGLAGARAARRALNSWYARFPDRDGVVLSRLRGDRDDEVLQAIDELYVHDLLARSCEPRYEEDEKSPDFRLY